MPLPSKHRAARTTGGFGSQPSGNLDNWKPPRAKLPDAPRSAVCHRCGANVYLVRRYGKQWLANTTNGYGPETWHSRTCPANPPVTVRHESV